MKRVNYLRDLSTDIHRYRSPFKFTRESWYNRSDYYSARYTKTVYSENSTATSYRCIEILLVVMVRFVFYELVNSRAFSCFPRVSRCRESHSGSRFKNISALFPMVGAREIAKLRNSEIPKYRNVETQKDSYQSPLPSRTKSNLVRISFSHFLAVLLKANGRHEEIIR